MNKKKSNRRVITLGIILVIILVGFISMLTVSSRKVEALESINACVDEVAVREVWDDYQLDLGKDADFVKAVRDKLESFDLNNEALTECLEWLPPGEVHTNIIIVPDFSERLFDAENNPDQAQRDLDIVMGIWQAFTEIASKPDSKDQIVVALTDNDRLNGDVAYAINNLMIDMEHVDRIPGKPFFNSYRKGKFKKNFKNLQTYAANAPIAADFYGFLRLDIEDYLRKPTLYDVYENKLIIITDGNMEEWDTEASLLNSDKKDGLEWAVKTNTVRKFITRNRLNFQPVLVDFSNTKAFVCEINGPAETPWYYEEFIIEQWQDWFEQMGCPVDVHANNIPSNQVVNEVRKFILD